MPRIEIAQTAKVIGVIASMASLAAHADDTAPLNYFLHAAGPAAAPTLTLGWIFTAICTAVCVIVAVLLIAGIVRRRPELPARGLIHTSGMRWIVIGVGVSTLVLAAMLAHALVTLERVAAPPATPALTITVTAYDWWWKVAYDDSPDSARRFVTANEIHIPAGEPVRIVLRSADVIHAFWVPRLAGKTQAIPGQTNEQWIQADAPGVYRGQCTQFCGAQHAHMAFEVVAQDRAAFAAWLDRQARPVAPAASTLAGHKLFVDKCAGCHAIRGTDANGMQAPDLTHLNARRLIAAGALKNTPQNQLDWIAHAQSIKPESLMPSIALTSDEAEELSAYLATLN
ncbi:MULTISPECIES: cytochrome c oxidase subunit II [unclassified Caballeronia]|uniref:cytochrome c oxidase subunit II n=1 Tax=unclassified Caballeronia TaxID=2646786 RepID=UPI003857A8FD